jgi:hypothetical protein
VRKDNPNMIPNNVVQTVDGLHLVLKGIDLREIKLMLIRIEKNP